MFLLLLTFLVTTVVGISVFRGPAVADILPVPDVSNIIVVPSAVGITTVAGAPSISIIHAVVGVFAVTGILLFLKSLLSSVVEQRWANTLT